MEGLPSTTSAVAPRHARVARLFLFLLGLIWLDAFVSLGVQVLPLLGSEGLLPAREFLDATQRALGFRRFARFPTLFWLGCGDAALLGACLLGAALSLGVALNLAPRLALASLWVLYLSLVSVARDFLSFQWDNLLLEAGFLAILLAPGGWRPRGGAEPRVAIVFLFRWLLFRLHVESGVAKWISGDPTWRDLTAMAHYYETAPLPTWVGWWAHQVPLPVQKVSSALTYVFELLVPFGLWFGRRTRLVSLPLLAAFQVSIFATANYGFFNPLSLALLVFLLDDARLEGPLPTRPPGPAAPRRTGALSFGFAAAVVAATALDFADYASRRALPEPLAAVHRAVVPLRSFNTYHLFAVMTKERLEVEIQGTEDGAAWETYEFRYKAGDPRRAPPFVAPHQPRLDFQLWFLLLRPRFEGALYFESLLRRLCSDPGAVARLFARVPFGDRPPRAIRVAVHRYRMTDRATRRATGEWWSREFRGWLVRDLSCETLR